MPFGSEMFWFFAPIMPAVDVLGLFRWHDLLLLDRHRWN
jgi:hypothetical protein